jgi:hypothetical protein
MGREMIPSIIEDGVPHIGARNGAAVLLGALLTVAAVQPAYAEDSKGKKPLLVAFHIDLLGDQLKDAVASTEKEATPQAMEFNLVGLPVKLGVKDDTSVAGMALEAGVESSYDIDLGERLSLTTTASLSKTGFLDNSWGTDRASAMTSLRYRHDGLVLALEPAWTVRMQESVLTQSDYGARARFSKSLFKGFDLSGGVAYGRHDSQAPTDDYANASAFATLSYRLAGRMKLDLSYAASYKLPDELQAGSLSLDDLDYAENTAGPTVTMSFPLWDALEIAATYRYCRSEDDVPRRNSTGQGGERRVDNIQSFDMSAAWHSDDPDFGGINFTAAYAYDRLATNARDADEQSHAATFAMAIPF